MCSALKCTHLVVALLSNESNLGWCSLNGSIRSSTMSMSIVDYSMTNERIEFLTHMSPFSTTEGGLHPDDLSRIKNRKKWLQRFLEYNDLSLKTSLDQLWNTCVWRKNNNVNGEYCGWTDQVHRKSNQLPGVRGAQ